MVRCFTENQRRPSISALPNQACSASPDAVSNARKRPSWVAWLRRIAASSVARSRPTGPSPTPQPERPQWRQYTAGNAGRPADSNGSCDSPSTTPPSSDHRNAASAAATRSMRDSSRTHRCRSTVAASRPATARTCDKHAARCTRNPAASSSPSAPSGNTAAARSSRETASDVTSTTRRTNGCARATASNRAGSSPTTLATTSASVPYNAASTVNAKSRASPPTVATPSFTAARSERTSGAGSSPHPATWSGASPTHSSSDRRDSVITDSGWNGSPNTVEANCTIAAGSPLSPNVAEVATGVIRPNGRAHSSAEKSAGSQ